MMFSLVATTPLKASEEEPVTILIKQAMSKDFKIFILLNLICDNKINFHALYHIHEAQKLKI